MATRKTIDYKPESYNNTNDDFMKLLTGEGSPQQDVTQKRPAINNNLEEDPTEERRLINIRINVSLFKEWKQFCLIHDMTLTAVIKKAMRLLMQGVEDKTIEL